MATTAPAAVGARSFPPVALVGDEALALRVRCGDEGAFEELCRRHHPGLYRYCASVLGDPHEAEEALQWAMLGAYRALRRREGDEELHVRAWLYRIAHNQCMDIIRRRRPTHELTELEQEPGLGVEERAAVREDLRQLRRDLAALAPEQRTALVLRELSGFSHAEIAATLEATPAAAKQLIHDARRSLASFATGRGMACAEVQRRISDRDGRVLRGAAIRSHLRACPDCARHRDAIGERSARLECLAPPLAPLAAQGILAAVLEGGAGGLAAGGAAVAGGAAAGAGGGGLALKLAALGATAVAGVAAVGIVPDSPERPAEPAPARVATVALDRAAAVAPASASVRARAARGPERPAPPPRPPSTEPSPVPGSAPAPTQAGGEGPAPSPPHAAETAGAGGDPPARAELGASAEAGPASAAVAVGAGSGGIAASAQVGAVSAAVDADVASGAVAASANAGPAAVSGAADLPAASASVSAQTSVASAGVTVAPGAVGVTVNLPVQLPPLPR